MTDFSKDDATFTIPCHFFRLIGWLGLTQTELMVFAIYFEHGVYDAPITITNDRLAELLCVSVRTITRANRKLKDVGLIVSKSNNPYHKLYEISNDAWVLTDPEFDLHWEEEQEESNIIPFPNLYVEEVK